MIKQQKLWDHYPAIIHGLWSSVWSSFVLGLCRLFEFREDDRLGSLASLIRRIHTGEYRSGDLPQKWELKRQEFHDAAPGRLAKIKAIDADLAILRSGYLAHLDMTKAQHPKTNIPLDALKSYQAFAADVLNDYFLAFRDESHSYEPTNFGP